GSDGRFEDVRVRALDGTTQQIAVRAKTGGRLHLLKDGAAHHVDDDVDGEPRSDFAGIVPAHAVGDDEQPEIFANREAVFVGKPDLAFVGDADRAEHRDCYRR